MAYPNDPSSPGSREPGAFANARLSSDDFERLAAAFRPSWELDDAPFAGPGSLSPADVRALQGGGTRADVRAAVAQGTNGAYPSHPSAPVAGTAAPRSVARRPPPPPPP